MHSDQGVARILCSRIADGKDIGGSLVKTFVKLGKIGQVCLVNASYHRKTTHEAGMATKKSGRDGEKAPSLTPGMAIPGRFSCSMVKLRSRGAFSESGTCKLGSLAGVLARRVRICSIFAACKHAG